jgi:hypothetical protein
MEQQIKSLASRSSAFSDVCTRFGRLWDGLNELDGEPVDTQRVQNEVKHLETLMLSMLNDQMRV